VTLSAGKRVTPICTVRCNLEPDENETSIGIALLDDRNTGDGAESAETSVLWMEDKLVPVPSAGVDDLRDRDLPQRSRVK
jgi:hypothetical protein